jgi:aldehyde dehydrogenase (NAD+)
MLLMLEEGEGEFLAALRDDMGKSPMEGWLTDLASVAREVRYALQHLDAWMRPERARVPLQLRPARAEIVREPLGVVLVIAPWNFPIRLALLPAASAIAAGNCVVVKPSEVSSASAAALTRLVPRYLDPACVAVVEGGPDETRALLGERFDHVFFTGNAAVGRLVMEAAARHLTPVTLELGGKSPVIVDRDADLKVAGRRVAWGKFLNAGQTCVAPDYALVHGAVEEAFVSAVRAAVRRFYGGDPRRSPDYPRIVNERHAQRLQHLLARHGGEVVAGGEVDVAGRYVAPTIVRGVAPNSPLMEEEIFGPILPVLGMRDVDDAIEFVNARPKPLSLYLFASDPETARRVTARTSSGGVCVNATLLQFGAQTLPFGGVGESGFGAYHGRFGFETFSHRKAVLTKSPHPDPRFAYPPYTPARRRLLRRFV